MRLLIRFFHVTALMLSVAHFALAGQTTPAPQQSVCGKVEKITCEGKTPRFTTRELKPKSKDLPVQFSPRVAHSSFRPQRTYTAIRKSAPEDEWKHTDDAAASS